MQGCGVTKVFFDEELLLHPLQATWSHNVSLVHITTFNTSTACAKNETLDPWQLEHDAFVISANGIVSPLLVIFTILTSSFICLVLLKPHMRTPTNTLLVAIAITDVMTGVWPLPCYIFFYTFEYCYDWMPYSWCPIYPILTEYLPTISHTSSVWLTVILAFQRYVCICHSHKGRRWFSRSNVVKAIVCVHAAAILTHANRFFEHVINPVEVTSLLDANVTMTSCVETLVPFVLKHANVYFNVYYWFRVVFIHLVPCASLLILNVLLINTLQDAQQRKVRLMGRQKSDSGSSRPSESNSTTLMLVFVVGLFLLVEFPLAVLFIVYIVQNTFGLTIIDDASLLLATNVVNLIILFSYPINFFIYCAMSRKFRETFTRMVLHHRRRGSDASNNTQYYSLAMEAETRATHVGQPDVVAMTGC